MRPELLALLAWSPLRAMIDPENDDRALGGLHAMDNDVRQAGHYHFAGTLQCTVMTDHGKVR